MAASGSGSRHEPVHAPGLRHPHCRHAAPSLWAATNAPLAAAASKGELGAIYDEIERRHDETVARLQAWIKQPSISAENIGMEEGAELMKQLALDAGFQHAEIVPTKGHPSVFATLDAGAKETLGLYFMYDVKQADPAEWSSPPWDAKLVECPGLGTVLIGRAATNQKGPQAAFLAAMHAIRGAGKKIPVNLVLVAEGEEEVGSPNFAQVCHDTPHVRAALEKCVGIFMPSHSQESDGSVADHPRLQGRHRVRPGRDRREMGPRPDARRAFEHRRRARPAGLAPGAGAQHARHARRAIPRSTASSSTCDRSRPKSAR